MQPKVEGRLLQALEANANADDLLDVVFSFEPPAVKAPGPAVPLVKRREARASAMLKTIELALSRAGEIAGTQPTQVTRFPLTGSALVQAPRSYVRALMDQSEVAGAMLNTGSSRR